MTKRVAPMDVEEIRVQSEQIAWFHPIDLGGGIVTKGASEPTVSPDQFPEVSGRSVLDIGAWDGYYSFMAERLGAARVVSLDHYAWGVDFHARWDYWKECIANGTLPDHDRDTTDFWRADLPGRRGFDFARDVLGSSVEPIVGDIATVDTSTLGTFDVVLFLGVLYHMKEPLTILEKVRSLTGEVALVETQAVQIAGLEEASLAQFHPGGELLLDYGNWYVPTIAALHGLCRAAGFSRVETVAGPPPPANPPPWRSLFGIEYRRAPQEHTYPATPQQLYRAVVRAYP